MMFIVVYGIVRGLGEKMLNKKGKKGDNGILIIGAIILLALVFIVPRLNLFAAIPLYPSSTLVNLPLSGNTQDISGNNLAVMESGVLWGQAQMFTNSSYIRIPAASQFTFNDSFTITADVYLNGLTQGYIVTQTGGFVVQYYIGGAWPSGAFEGTLYNSAGAWMPLNLDSPTIPVTGRWYRIDFVLDKPTSKMRLYVNRTLEKEVTYNFTKASPVADVIIGNRLTGGRNFNGQIKNVIIRNVALTAMDIQIDGVETSNQTPICTANSKQCYPTGASSYRQCAADGMSWLSVVSCASGQTCSNGNCITPPICTANLKECLSTSTYRQCSADGLSWGASTGCGSGLTCSGGNCISGLCSANLKECYPTGASSYRQCAADGLSWGSTISCSSGLICTAGNCVASSCTLQCTSPQLLNQTSCTCYTPSTTNQTTSCTTNADCSDDMVCGTDGKCVVATDLIGQITKFITDNLIWVAGAVILFIILIFVMKK